LFGHSRGGGAALANPRVAWKRVIPCFHTARGHAG
jgi:hypothetical protein